MITPPPQKKLDAGGSRTTAGNHHTSASGVAEGVVEGRVDDVHCEDGKRDGRWEGDDDDDRPLASRRRRTAQEVDLEDRLKLWVDYDVFLGQGPEKPLREAIGDYADYFVPIAKGDAGAEPPSMLIMPTNDVPRFKIDDSVQHGPALCRTRIVEKLAMRTLRR
ncbi:hypothetical protein CBR_g16902 [Chara braunii]|uniref:Uncharacterized protein n=1 Tax=Chara braunii TaxID=69332 RepID=A0A388KU43_CHABU|nr:hypothetical protein CBR_g16902 [Chara braunii]|eukprot:GBG73559.1 hypothetical protein CBR_g16902 [Chara braunii]